MAIFSKETDQFRSYKYNVDEFQIMIKGETIELPSIRFNQIMILDDYENNTRPLFRIEIVLESSIYYKIIENKHDVTFRIRIIKYYNLIQNGNPIDTSNTTEDSDETVLYQVYMDDAFDLILDDADFDVNIGIKKEEAETDNDNIVEDDTNKLEEVDNTCEFFLYKADMVNSSQVMVNGILENATVSDAIAYIANKAGISNILMSIPDNTKSYPSLLIPALPAYKAIEFIDTYYGLYEMGGMLYFALDKIYLIKYEGPCTAYERNEIKETTIVIPTKKSGYSDESCTVFTDKSSAVNYIVTDSEAATIQNQSVTNDVLYGSDSTIVDTYKGSVTAASSTALSRGAHNKRLFENKTENIFFDRVRDSIISANSVVVEIGVNNYDIGAIQPNKLFTLVFEDSTLTQKYNGSYVLVYAYHNFIKSGDEFELMSVLRLKKTS